MYLRVSPISKIKNEKSIKIPSSKPETQRAIVVGSLAKGKTVIRNDLRCSETAVTKKAMAAIGAKIIEHKDYIEIYGVDSKCQSPTNVIDCGGSGFAFRTMSVISSFVEGTVIISGDKVLKTRIMQPLFEAMNHLGAKLVTLYEDGKAPVANFSMGIDGGECVIPGNTCSQFTTALLLGLPLANNPVKIRVHGDIVSGSYIKQTIKAMEMAGVILNTDEPSSYYEIKPSKYVSFETTVSGDFTSASYMMAIATLFKGELILDNLTEDSFQGERLMISILRELGLQLNFVKEERKCHITNPHRVLEGEYAFNVKDCPNILPTLAVIGAFIEGKFRVTGGRVTNYHKSPRIRAIVSELKKLGVDITEIYDKKNQLDGFEIIGKTTYQGGITLSSWGDHRIFLSLFIASLRTSNPNMLDGYQDVHCSFPDFFNEARKLGLNFEEVPKYHRQEEYEVELI